MVFSSKFSVKIPGQGVRQSFRIIFDASHLCSPPLASSGRLRHLNPGDSTHVNRVASRVITPRSCFFRILRWSVRLGGRQTNSDGAGVQVGVSGTPPHLSVSLQALQCPTLFLESCVAGRGRRAGRPRSAAKIAGAAALRRQRGSSLDPVLSVGWASG